MSLDLSLKCPYCEAEAISFNYTYNVSSMWYAIYPDDKKMVFIDGLTGQESQSKLEHAIASLKANPEKFEAMNPSNGWGDYNSFIVWLETLLQYAKENPNHVWESWR